MESAQAEATPDSITSGLVAVRILDDATDPEARDEEADSSSASKPGTPGYSLPGTAAVEVLKKQLFLSSDSDSPSDLESTVTSDSIPGQDLVSNIATAGPGVEVPPWNIPAALDIDPLSMPPACDVATSEESVNEKEKEVELNAAVSASSKAVASFDDSSDASMKAGASLGDSSAPNMGSDFDAVLMGQRSRGGVEGSDFDAVLEASSQASRRHTCAVPTSSDLLPGSPGLASRSQKDLKIHINPASAASVTRAFNASSAPDAAVSASPGAVSFAPPFGAKFGNRTAGSESRRAAAGAMDKVQEDEKEENALEEEEEGGYLKEHGVAADAVTESDTATSVYSTPSAAHTSFASVPSAEPQESPQSAASAPSITCTSAAMPSGIVPGNGESTHGERPPNVSSVTDQEAVAPHAHRVASTAQAKGSGASSNPGATGSTTNCSTPGAADGPARPRLRVAYEGKRDEVLAPVDSSKFAPTPRVNGKGVLSWDK